MEKIVSFLPMVLIFVVFYFMLIKPQQKRAKDAQNMQASLEAGNKVVTIGGMHATIVEVKDTTIIVKTVDGGMMEFEKTAVRSVTAPEVE